MSVDSVLATDGRDLIVMPFPNFRISDGRNLCVPREPGDLDFESAAGGRGGEGVGEVGARGSTGKEASSRTLEFCAWT